MHESRLVADLVTAAGLAIDGETVGLMRLRVGAMAGVSPEALRHGIAHHAADRWGAVPVIEIEESTDPIEPGALGVTLVAVATPPATSRSES